jgi:RimJ/RimL family protein N-acetyltransferase
MTKRSVFLEAKNILLCSMLKEDFGPTMENWLHDKDVTKYLSRGTFPSHPELLNQEFERTSNQQTDIQLAILDRETKAYIGVVGLHSLNWLSRHAEFRILIGNKDFWGKGYGTEACQLMVAYGIEALNLNKVWLGVNTANRRAYDSYIKAGFKAEGVLRQELYRNNQYYDIARMSILRDEYLKTKRDWSSYEWIKKTFSE